MPSGDGEATTAGVYRKGRRAAMLFIPPPYRILAALAGAVALLAFGAWTGHTWTERRWVAAVAQQKAEAARVLADAIERNRQREAEDAEKARNRDAAYQAEINALQDGASDRERDLLGSLRNIQGRWQSCRNAAASQAASAGNAAGTAPDAARGVLEQAARDLEKLGSDADRLTAWAKVCHAWAKENGR